MRPDLNRLAVFQRVFQHRGVAAAAAELHITQSAVSQSLKKLEVELDTRLFTRLHRRLVPTGAGEALYRLAAPLLDSLEVGIRHLQRAGQEPYGPLRIGAPVEFGQRYLPPLFARFRRQFPNVTFTLQLGHPTLLLPLLKAGSLDLAFADIFTPQTIAAELAILHVEPLFEETLELIGAADYLEQRGLRGRVAPERLAAAEFIAYDPHAPSLRSWFRHHLDLSLASPNLVLTVESVRAACAGVRHSLGLAVLPSHVVADELAIGELAAVETARPPLRNQIALVQLQDKVPTLTERTFMAFCKEETFG